MELKELYNTKNITLDYKDIVNIFIACGTLLNDYKTIITETNLSIRKNKTENNIKQLESNYNMLEIYKTNFYDLTLLINKLEDIKQIIINNELHKTK